MTQLLWYHHSSENKESENFIGLQCVQMMHWGAVLCNLNWRQSPLLGRACAMNRLFGGHAGRNLWKGEKVKRAKGKEFHFVFKILMTTTELSSFFDSLRFLRCLLFDVCLLKSSTNILLLTKNYLSLLLCTLQNLEPQFIINSKNLLPT